MPLTSQDIHSKDRVPSKVANAELVAERRRHLVKSATSLFLQKGFHKASVREIASAAGWQMGTLYLYISKKEDVLYLISQTIMDHLWDGLHELPYHDDPLVALQESMVYYFDAVNELRNEIRLLYRESASLMPEHLQALKESELEERTFFATIVQRAITQRLCRPTDSVLFAHNIIMLAHQWPLKKWAHVGRYTFEQYKAAQISVLWEMLTGRPLFSTSADNAVSS